MRVVIGYGLAVICSYLTGAVLISQGNISRITDMGFEITLTQRLDSAGHDIMNMYSIYMPLIAIALLIAFVVAAQVIQRLPHLRLLGYILAGFVGMVAIHVVLKQVVGISGIAPARTLAGLFAQGVAGALGGYCFYWITQQVGSDQAER
ncbi:MAG: hypothetical protein HOJ61_18795 [Gammaproteobacteria bacterium]|jgi:hypothetical protein|nr:hypothetical protein [Gammaproteobacteria bacterium]